MKRQSQNKKIIIGITGGFGTGKTAVAKILKSFGAEVIDADEIAHRIIKPGGKIYRDLVYAFGRGVLYKNRNIDRKRLGKLAFKNKKLLKRLNRIMHGPIIRTIKERMHNSPKKIIVVDAPLLIEAGLNRIVNKIIVVVTTKKKQLKRALRRKAFTKGEVLKRIKAQMPLKEKFRFADFIIDNSGSIEKTKKELEEIRRLLWKN